MDTFFAKQQLPAGSAMFMSKGQVKIYPWEPSQCFLLKA